jgi:hypothetical protein
MHLEIPLPPPLLSSSNRSSTHAHRIAAVARTKYCSRQFKNLKGRARELGRMRPTELSQAAKRARINIIITIVINININITITINITT